MRGTQIEHVEQAESVLINLLKVIQQGVSISLKDVEAAIKMAKKGTIHIDVAPSFWL